MAATCKECGKKAHHNYTAAIYAALRNSSMFGRAFRAYECPAGNGYHLTTKPMREAS